MIKPFHENLFNATFWEIFRLSEHVRAKICCVIKYKSLSDSNMQMHPCSTDLQVEENGGIFQFAYLENLNFFRRANVRMLLFLFARLHFLHIKQKDPIN